MKKTDQTVKVPSLVRELNAERFEIRAEDGLTKISFSASSETPIERWFGEEVLSHDKSAIRLDRVKRGRCSSTTAGTTRSAWWTRPGSRTSGSSWTRTSSRPSARPRCPRC